MFQSKDQCSNCWHSPHGSTDLDSCREVKAFGQGATCNCKNYVRWNREEYQRKCEQEKEELEARLAKENGLENHPRRSLLWSMAWEHGHSSGLSEVEMWYNDLAELMK